MDYNTDQKYTIDELTDPNSFLYYGYGYDEEETGFTDEDKLEGIKGIFLSLKEDEYITPDDFEDVLNQWYVPDKYQKYLAEFVAELNRDHSEHMKFKQRSSSTKKRKESYDQKILQDMERFQFIPKNEDLEILKKRYAYVDFHGKTPSPEEIMDIDKFYMIIQKQFRSKTDNMEVITDEDIIYISTCWNLSPVQLIKVTQLASYANTKAKALIEEQKLLDDIKEKYTYEKTEPSEEELRIFVAREKAARKYLRRPSFAEVAELTGKYTAEEVRQIFYSYFTKLYDNGRDFLLAPYLQRLKNEEECWSLTDDDIETIKFSWNTILQNYIINRQNLYYDAPYYYKKMIVLNETVLLSTGNVPSIAYLSRSLQKDEDMIRSMIFDLIGHMSFSHLKEIRAITKRWDLTDAEKRKIEFDADIDEYEETINIDKAKGKMLEIADSIEELCRLDKDNPSYYTDKTFLILSVNETQGVYIKSISDNLKAIAISGKSNINYYWGDDNEEEYLLIEGLKEGNAIITVENDVDTSLLHIFVIVLP